MRALQPNIYILGWQTDTTTHPKNAEPIDDGILYMHVFKLYEKPEHNTWI